MEDNKSQGLRQTHTYRETTNNKRQTQLDRQTRHIYVYIQKYDKKIYTHGDRDWNKTTNA